MFQDYHHLIVLLIDGEANDTCRRRCEVDVVGVAKFDGLGLHELSYDCEVAGTVEVH